MSKEIGGVMNKVFKKVTTESDYEIWNDVRTGLADVLEKKNKKFNKKDFIELCKYADKENS